MGTEEQQLGIALMVESKDTGKEKKEQRSPLKRIEWVWKPEDKALLSSEDCPLAVCSVLR